MFDLLMSADMKVSDPDATTTALVQRLGVLEHPKWRMANPGSNYVAWFLRVHPSLAVAPTRLEPQGHFDGPNLGDPLFTPYLDSVVEVQGRFRPVKTHSTILITSEFDAVIERLRSRNVPHRIAPTSPHLPFDRLWVGASPEHPRYDPRYDGGLCIEVMPRAPLQLPPETGDAPEPTDPQPGDLVRVVQRGFLVRDLDRVLHLLEANLGIVAPAGVKRFDEEGFARARVEFSLPHSATLDLVSPTRWDSELGRYLANWGPGPHYIRIAVHDLEAKGDDLDARRTPFTRRVATESAPDRLGIDPATLGGVIVEFVEHEPARVPI